MKKDYKIVYKDEGIVKIIFSKNVKYENGFTIVECEDGNVLRINDRVITFVKEIKN